MSAPVDPSGIEEMVEQTLRTLRQATGGAEPSEDAEPLEGHGEAAGGLIRVTAVPGGKLSELYLDPRTTRMTTVALAEEIVLATNAALADLQQKIQSQASAVPMEGLVDRLKEIQEQSVPQMRSFLESLSAAQDRIAASGR